MQLRNRKVVEAETDPYRHGIRLANWKLVEERLKTDNMVIVLGATKARNRNLAHTLQRAR